MVFVITGTGCRTASAYEHSPTARGKAHRHLSV